MSASSTAESPASASSGSGGPEAPSPEPVSPGALPLPDGGASKVERSAGVAVAVAVECMPRLSLVAQQAGVSPVQAITVTNLGSDDLEDVLVELEADPSLGPAWTQRLASIPAGQRHRIVDVRLPLSPTALLARRESARGLLRVRVHVGASVVEHVEDVDILAASAWPGSAAPLELLACFVMPADPALAGVLRAASDRLEAATGSGALSGYQSGLRADVVAQVQALYLAVCDLGLHYLSPPASFEDHGQKVLPHGELLQARAGACLDLSAIMAALLERCGLHPLLVVVDGHAFVGVWLEPMPLQDAVHDSVLALRKRVDLDEVLVLEATAVASGASFADARAAARAHLDQDEAFRFFLDVHGARRVGMRPLPRTEAEVAPAPESEGPQLDWDGVAVQEREDAVAEPVTRGRIDRWKDRLLDLTLRNGLLNHRPGARSVSLPWVDVATLEDRLASGESVVVRPRPERDRTTTPDALASLSQALQAQGVVLADHPDQDLFKRLTELFRQGRSSLLESGAITVYLALGFLRWQARKTPDQDRLAPLVLLPVELERGRGIFKVRLAGDAEPQLNVTLLTLLRREHQLDHPGLDPDNLPEDSAGLDLPLLLRRFRELVRAEAGWEVESRAAIAPFTFTKFLMWKDLVASTDALLKNDVVKHIFDGDGQPLALLRPQLGEARLDDAVAPEALLTAVSADPSQLSAMAACADGSSFVLQGPPGTGKSQTITNIIADTLARGQTVLFVAEKKAAIDVVHRRLKAVGLGPFAFELHSDKASKKAAMAQVREAVEHRGRVEPKDWQAEASALVVLREELNTYAAALRAPTGWGPTVHGALSRLIALRDTPQVDVGYPALDAAVVRAQDDQIARALPVLQLVGPLVDNVWRQAAVSTWSADLPRALRAALVALTDAVTEVREAGTGTVFVAQDGVGIAHEGALARAMVAGAAVPPALLDAPRWAAVQAEIDGVQTLCRQRAAAWAPLAPTWSPGLLSADRSDLRARFEQWAGVWLVGWLMLWFQRPKLKALWVDVPPTNSDVRDALVTADQVAALDQRIVAQDGRARVLLGEQWQGVNTDWDDVHRVLDAAQRLRSAIVASTDDTARREALRALVVERGEELAAEGTLGRSMVRVAEAADQLAGARRALETVLVLPEDALAEENLDGLDQWVQRWSDMGGLRDWCAWRRVRATLVAGTLGPFVAALERGPLHHNDLEHAIVRSRCLWSWRSATRAVPALQDFHGVRHEAAIQRFRELDAQWEQTSQRLIQARVAAGAPAVDAPGEMATIRRQLELKRSHMPLRTLFRTVPTVLRALKPCVLMSPLSVARYLDPHGQPYDLVIFDEASQIPPWDAIGAIARGRRTIIVGDSRQLPPTSFFSRGDDDEDELPDEDSLVDLESILEEATSAGLPQLRLRWHYRSRHESLITFSNRTYYNNGLLTFPAVAHAEAGLGVELVPVPEGHYDRGGSRTNRGEADRIVAWVRSWLSGPVHREKTVGIVTFNMAQQRLIEDLLDQEVAVDPDLEAALSAATGPSGDEPLFVKNLENVQGDERDIMLFSICYGPDAGGRVAMNFGPLNKKGGERRLNVAITRAREQLLVFSTLRHDQIQLSRTRSVGVQHLRTFLDFARRGVVALDEQATVDAHRDTESPFEDEVCAVLRDLGWGVVPQVGCSGYRIDLAVEDPDRPGRFLLAVECDGATYHSSANARARDRQRQAVLEGLGWRFHRIWSTDWWESRGREVQRLQAALRDAMAGALSDENDRPQAIVMVPSAPDEPVAEVACVADELRFVVPEPVLRGDKAALRSAGSRGAVADALAELLTACAPIHEDQAWRWLAQCWGYGGATGRVKIGVRLREACEAAAQALVVTGRAEHAEGFLWMPDQRERWTAWRAPGDGRVPAHICAEEACNVAAAVLEGALALGRDELELATARRLGFDRTGAQVAELVSGGVDRLLATGRGMVKGDKVVRA